MFHNISRTPLRRYYKINQAQSPLILFVHVIDLRYHLSRDQDVQRRLFWDLLCGCWQSRVWGGLRGKRRLDGVGVEECHPSTAVTGDKLLKCFDPSSQLCQHTPWVNYRARLWNESSLARNHSATTMNCKNRSTRKKLASEELKLLFRRQAGDWIEFFYNLIPIVTIIETSPAEDRFSSLSMLFFTTSVHSPASLRANNEIYSSNESNPLSSRFRAWIANSIRATCCSLDTSNGL